MTKIILRIWNGESFFGKLILFLPLFVFSRVYSLCLAIRNMLYNSGYIKIDEVSIPVVAVGNITVGGTGKTPVVEKLANSLKEIGFNPGIVTRGYKRTRQGTFCIDRNNDRAEEVGDEAFMLSKKTMIPVSVGTRRALAVNEAMKKYNIDIAILDDGFQARNIKKNVEIVVVKGGDHNKSADLFPLGPRRESAGRLRYADAVLINNGSIPPDIANLLADTPTFRMKYRPVHLYNMRHNLITHYNMLTGKKVCAFSGLGDNKSFFEMLRSLGAQVEREFSFQDHHVYRMKDIEKILSFCEVNLIVTTEKDAVKISGMDIPDNLFYLSVEAIIEDQQRLMEIILEKIGSPAFEHHGLGSGNRFQKH